MEVVTDRANVRLGWLKVMYVYTIVGAGSFGLGLLIAPGMLKSLFGWPAGDPIPLGITGSVYVAFAILSVMGLRSPVKFVPVLLLQLFYKAIWFVGVILPLLISGQFPMYATLYVIIFATYIIGDIIAIPFSLLFAK